MLLTRALLALCRPLIWPRPKFLFVACVSAHASVDQPARVPAVPLGLLVTAPFLMDPSLDGPV